MAHEPIYIGADMDVSYEDAAVGGTPQTAGSCGWVLETRGGVEVDSGSMPHVADGTYTGTIDAAVTGTLTEGAMYYLLITFTQGQANDYRRIVTEAAYRGHS